MSLRATRSNDDSASPPDGDRRGSTEPKAPGPESVVAPPAQPERRSPTKRTVHLIAAACVAVGTRVDRSLDRRLGGPARKRTIVLLAAVLALNGANSGAIGAMAVQLERSLHIDNTGLGLLVTTSSVAGAVVSIPVGSLADRFNRRWLLLAGLAVWTIAAAGSAFAGTLTALVAFELVIGAASAVAGPSVASLTGDFFSSNERGGIYGFILTGELVGAGFGIVVAGDLGAAIGWRAGLFLLGLAGAGLTWLVFRNLTEPPRGGSGRLPASGVDREGTPPGESTSGRPASATLDVDLPREIRRQGFVPNPRDPSERHPSDSGSSPLPGTSCACVRTCS